MQTSARVAEISDKVTGIKVTFLCEPRVYTLLRCQLDVMLVSGLFIGRYYVVGWLVGCVRFNVPLDTF